MSITDALELANQLQLEISYNSGMVVVRTGLPRNLGAQEPIYTSCQEATIQAIYKVAAEIGKTLG